MQLDRLASYRFLHSDNALPFPERGTFRPGL